MDYAAMAQAAAAMLGQMVAQGQEARARKLYQDSLDEFGNLDLPKFQEIAAQELGPAAMESVRADPKLVASQNAALGQYDEIIDGDGFNAADEASMNAVGNQIARRAGANRAGIAQGFAANGMAQSGAAVAAQMGNAQAANQQLNEAGLNTTAAGQASRRNALAAKGALAGTMRNQDVSERSRAAQAHDDTARYNANARMSAAQQNNANMQTQFQNAFNRQTGKAGAAGVLGNAYNNQAANTRQFFGNMGAGVGESIRASQKPSGGGNQQQNAYGYSAPPMVSAQPYDEDEWAPWGGY